MPMAARTDLETEVPSSWELSQVHRSVDLQHTQLFAAITDLWVASEAGVSRQSLADVMLDLFDFIRTHFADEESLMAAMEYPQILEQQEEHALFVRVLMRTAVDFLCDDEASIEPFLDSARAWLTEHSASHDSRFIAYL